MHDASWAPGWLLWAWFGLTLISALYVTWDLFTRTPEMKVMKWGWVLVTLYTGPVGLAIYWFSCREPAPGAHEQFIAPLWKQAVGSTIHCAAGDATGIIVAAGITGVLGLRMGVDIWVEYAAGFAFGLFIFQALFMKDMMNLGYGQAVRESFLPEWMSMNAMMAGMLPTMVILMSRDVRAMSATSPWFWAAMSAATLVGVAVAYPVNYWLVQHQLKHGMGTERALGKGGTPVTAEHDMAGMTGMAEMSPGPPVASAAGVPTGPAPMAGMDLDPDAPVSGGRKAAVTLLTLLMLAAGYWLAARYGDLSMRPGGAMETMPGMVSAAK
ncbi:copper oxidase [Hymenobacter psoromatis]|nr:copper oxidase [Hymenobacter psoromatis]